MSVQRSYASEAVPNHDAGPADHLIGSLDDVPHAFRGMIVIQCCPAALDLAAQMIEADAAAPCTVDGYDLHVITKE